MRDTMPFLVSIALDVAARLDFSSGLMFLVAPTWLLSGMLSVAATLCSSLLYRSRRRTIQCHRFATLGVRAGLISFVAAGAAISIEGASDVATTGYREFLTDYFAGLIVIGVISVPTGVCFLLRRGLSKRSG